MEIGDLINDRYRLIEKIGQGGMGQVVKAQDIILARTVAIKLLHAETSPTVVQRFQKEARVTAKLKHPNIVEVLDFGATESGDLFLVMEFLPGRSLSDLICKPEDLDIDYAIWLAIEICQGLKNAHEHGILHRDLKLSNVILVESEDNDPQVKILDFGLAKLEEEDQKLTQTGAAIGTPLYMSLDTASGKTRTNKDGNF
ncbi:MAG: serine/threonine protein kinase [Candidatus Obscuribacterales bacterium]|nr:serine/threonine protein kinase [Candidatus Obscuribacterales bacterium]